MSFVTSEERTPHLLSELLAILQGQGIGQVSLGQILADIRGLHGLVGAWAGGNRGSSSSSTSAVTDESGKGLHLTRNGAALFRLESLIPCITLDGSTAYLSHPDAAIFDITGGETSIFPTSQGLTCGAWVKFDNAASGFEAVMSKWHTANFSYNLTRLASGVMRFRVSNNGSTSVLVDSTATTAASQWYFVAGRFTPSTEVAIWVNSEKSVGTSGVPATLYSGTAAFGIGAQPDTPTDYLDGRIAMAFLCAAAVPDATILNLYHAGRRLFGA